jgi:hypothetical protein
MRLIIDKMLGSLKQWQGMIPMGYGYEIHEKMMREWISVTILFALSFY